MSSLLKPVLQKMWANLRTAVFARHRTSPQQELRRLRAEYFEASAKYVQKRESINRAVEELIKTGRGGPSSEEAKALWGLRAAEAAARDRYLAQFEKEPSKTHWPGIDHR